jgi:hypothetical protein
MKKPTARLIKYLRVGGTTHHSYRRIAELYYDERSNGYSNQGFGEDLLKTAADTLGENWLDWEQELETNLNPKSNKNSLRYNVGMLLFDVIKPLKTFHTFLFMKIINFITKDKQ